MALNKSKQAQVDFRRQQVASMRLRGMTQREIQTALVGMGAINLRTGKAYSIGTVNNDIKHLIQEWRDNARQDIQEMQAEILAQLQEVKRAAWAQSDLKAVLQALKQETRLMGLDAQQAARMLNIDVTKLTDEQLERIASGEDPIAVLATSGQGRDREAQADG